MWLGGRKARKKPRKKRRNARARYDKQYPVVPIRLHKSVKKQFAKEAEKKGLMLSQYIRELLQGLEVRECVEERVIEKVVEKPIIRMIENRERDQRMRDLEQQARKLKSAVSAQQAEVREASELRAKLEQERGELRESLSSLSKECNGLSGQLRLKGQELQRRQEEIGELRRSLSSATDLHEAVSDQYHQLETENQELSDEASRLLTENARLNKQLRWALSELESNDERNERILGKVARLHEIRVPYVKTDWGKMPKE